ncbi:N-acetyltransferase family protein [Hyphococcus sp. DH-69]|uniref:GNAT family N-acetyltransferase n=1 Tax=Hyphococcus formosus TaxID=3143534 RepID=UPI00398A970F
MTVSVRAATIGDEAIILSFIKELAEYEKLSHEVVATERDLEVTLFADNPRVFALIAEQSGAAVGFALYFFNYSTFLGKHGLYLEDLYVQRQYRGIGAGKALLASLAKIAVENDCGRMEWSVLDWNKPSIEFYRSLNAEPMDGWTTYRLTGDPLRALAAYEMNGR